MSVAWQMHPDSDPLHPLRMPLRGCHLIEASAGTGKTFTIAMLYVRLVLGHGTTDTAHGRPLTPPEILVVTFTEAATQELRDRIRARLSQAATYFRIDPAQITAPDGEDLLHELRSQYTPADWPTCARKLEVAAEWMDEAAVSTIHGWCNRMLHEHAFDSLSLFNQTLETDPSDLRSEVVRDYWRRFYYPLTTAAMAQVAVEWASPQALEDAVRPLWDHIHQLPDVASPVDLLAQCQREQAQTLQQLKAPWPAWADELQSLLDDAKTHKRFNGTKLRSSSYTDWLNAIRTWATSDQTTLELSEAAWNRLTPTGMADAWREAPVLDHPALHAMTPLREALKQLPEPRIGLLSHAARWIATEFDATQRRRSQLGFDDLLRGLHAALNGEHGTRLKEIIRQQFPVALIDEFQDTDPVQYQIFECIYELSQSHEDRALILIGDPKQAIYAFRGADIHTYLKARAAVGPHLHTLGTNHRSSQALVNATNHCFNRVEQDPQSQGAFLFRRHGLNPVPFKRVNAKGLTSSFQVQGAPVAAMALNVLPHEGKLSKERYIDQMAEICARQLVDWLEQGQADAAGFSDPQRGWQRLLPSDIAILVNNRQEANRMRSALARRGLRSVYLSDKDTVYETPQATEIYRWLMACANPTDDRLLKAALSTASLGLDFPALEALHRDDTAWESRLLQFQGYQVLWRQQGVLPMIRRILIDFHCPQRLLGQEADLRGQSGERILTDLLHLAELLQQASFTLEGEHALIRFLAEHIQQPRGGTDDKQLRLESDAHLIQVVTIHKSKGLEYPVVMLPFICATRPTKDSDVPLTWHDDDGVPHISLTPDEDGLARSDEERLGEDLRKLYVALTRARHHTWLGLAPLDTLGVSAMGHLMGLKDTPPTAFMQGVQAFAQGQPDLLVQQARAVTFTRFQAAVSTTDPGQACRPRRAAREHWWISSYSGLPIGGQRTPGASWTEDSAQAENWLEGQLERPLPDTRSSQAPRARLSHPMHQFPKGAQPGTFLHDLLEWCARAGFQTVLKQPDALRAWITQRCVAHRWTAWVDPLCDWLPQLLTTPLPVDGGALRLCEVDTARAEMEFWIETQQLDLQALDDAVVAHTLSGRPRPRLAPDSLTGMLKGFMDLVFEHDGRYYVADYKSNWLGEDESAYTPQAMEAAIRANRYDLQYVLYLFALHRLLQSRLPDYDYDCHVGGAVYLFVRGIAAPTAGVHFERPPLALMHTLDQLFSGQGGTPR